LIFTTAATPAAIYFFGGRHLLTDLVIVSVRLIEFLEESGVPRCPGDTMVSNPKWRLSLSPHYCQRRPPVSFLPHMARHVCHFPPPLGWFGRLKVESHGPYRGKFNLKKAGIFANTRCSNLPTRLILTP
jgi:CBS domain-containing protein